MSFSSRVKEELSHLPLQEAHCSTAELAAVLLYGGVIKGTDGQDCFLSVHTENNTIARRIYSLIKAVSGYRAGIRIGNGFHKNNSYNITLEDHKKAFRVLKITGFINNLGLMEQEEDRQFGHILLRTCCQRAFLRGAFLTSGSVTDPEKNYHFEIVCAARGGAVLLRDLMQYFGLEAKIVLRKKYYIVYLKEGTMISDALNLMGAHVALMDFENIRILKDVRNSVNRRVNCETANIHKTVSAARKQIEDIEYIQETVGLSRLRPALREMAEIRLEEPDATLKELGEMLNPPMGKSGVNHRLRKLSGIAAHIREYGSL